MTADRIKANGVHYTPLELARFLAAATVEHLSLRKGRISVLDPACGNGGLLSAAADALPVAARRRLVLAGFETDRDAIGRARALLADSGAAEVRITPGDFLASIAATGGELSLFDAKEPRELFDLVIANPPYVRTQVLGAKTAQSLAKRFGLSGRVDLYQAFAQALANILKPGGVLGLLTSNRFLTVMAGQSLRRLLRTEFDLRAVFDLGDTKLFSAAVLPVIVIATKRRGPAIESPCSFHRVYEQATDARDGAAEFESVIHALEDRDVSGAVKTGTGRYRIERGVLAPTQKPDDVWTLSTPESDLWLRRVRAHQQVRIEDVAKVRVGVKTTADDVFVRTDWDALPERQRPEPELLRPLITHRDAARWTVNWSGDGRRILYPHEVRDGRRTPIRLSDFPRAAAYLHAHAERLKRRKYVLESGRQWYELWVPHHPDHWSQPKIVFPDISEAPRFFLDQSGAVVQGDCYWIALKPGADPDWLPLILAVANSTFITRYYDLCFHNKLYSGRRRFMTQYVREFPLPPLSDARSQRIVATTKRLLVRALPIETAEAEIDDLVRQAFGSAGSG